MDDEPRSGKRDRLARITRVVSLLRAHPDGMPIRDIARRIDVSVRTVYRDLTAIEGEIGIAVWSDDGHWGLAADEFLPPLKLTQDEAMAVVLSARLMVRYADKYDPDLASAFEKLGEVLPRALGELSVTKSTAVGFVTESSAWRAQSSWWQPSQSSSSLRAEVETRRKRQRRSSEPR